ncbi:MAG: glutathione peroxidase [Chitinophagaceae bacterium]|nr:glutathione peroxidase [Chitinophagaceae bacterium]
MKTVFYSLLIAAGFITQISIYSFVIGTGNSSINFNDFQNKKILLVNIATGSPRANQLGELQQLKQQYGDSLVIVVFPSNSFGNESRSNAAIKEFCQLQYGVSYLLAAKGAVTGSYMQPVYQWLTHESQNGIQNSEIKGDFQKYLIDRNGQLLAIFAGSVSPLDPQIVSAITGSSN